MNKIITFDRSDHLNFISIFFLWVKKPINLIGFFK